MSTKEKVLSILLKNPEHATSGEQIAQSLNLSRTAIWKAINELKKEGHTIISTPNVGYTYIPSDILSKEEISLYLNNTLPPLTIQIEKKLESTNQTLKKEAIDGALNNTLLIAETQTKTRGRFGRSYFTSEKGQGIYMSLLLHTNLPFEEVAQYTLITAVAMAKTIESLTTKEVAIKWVNDLYMNNKKICGILSEAITDFETQTISSVIIGIGVNFSVPQGDFPKELQNKATSIFSETAPTFSRNELIGKFLNYFYAIIDSKSTMQYLDDYIERSFVLGKTVTFTHNNQLYTGRAKSITEKGELVVELGNEKFITLSSGEISLSHIQ